MYDFDKACYRCHWFKNGTCLHNKTFRNSNSDSRTVSVYYPAKGGIIRKTVKEGFTEKAFSGLKGNLESKLSKKKATEVQMAFFEELEAAKADWAETIDEAVTLALLNTFDESTEETAEIIEPTEFYCKYFM